MNIFLTIWISAVIISFILSIFLYAIDVVDSKFVVLCTAVPPVLIIATIMLIIFSFMNYVKSIKIK